MEKENLVKKMEICKTDSEIAPFWKRYFEIVSLEKEVSKIIPNA